MVAKRDQRLTRPVTRDVRLRIKALDMGIAVNADRLQRVRGNAAYRYLVRPAVQAVRSRRGGAPKPVYAAGHPALNGHTPAKSAPDTPEARAVLERISGYQWYHTIDLPHGVSTHGYVDHRAQLPYYHLPADMSGMRVLDVATFDGFWAFEFERRGAEVVAIDVASSRDTDIPRHWVTEAERETDLDAPKGHGFRVAHELLNSKVQKEICSIYDISPERLGMFDMVFCSDVLIHVRDPFAAIEAISTVTRDFAVFGDVYHPDLEHFKQNALVEFCQAGQSDVWWRPSTGAYRLWLQMAKFTRIDEKSRFILESEYQSEIPKVVFHAFK